MNVIDKVKRRERLTQEEATSLYDLDLFTLGELADERRRELHGKRTYFNINRHINPTNICKDICKFCAYSASRKNPNPYTMSHEEIVTITDDIVARGISEVHIVSAHNPDTGLEWYLQVFRKIKERHPQLHIKALTAAEVHFLAEEYHKSYDEILDLMVENGVDSMPGGGAEIFDEKVRDYICKGKVNSQQWLEIHRKWHERGMKSNVTMLFGHVEERSHRIDHMMRIRDLQDITGGFNCFIPLVYQTENNFLNVKEPITAHEILKTMAISRIVLDNVPNLKAYWVTSTVNLALVAQEFGANDLDGTIEKESINSAAGAKSAHGVNLNEFVALIKNSGFEPIERDSLYNTIKAW
ncbi:MAG: aminofutalosine synthase MqnE [Sulfuricurvum sp.]|uniref:aminofutalosine synthase MqnE n=2 Tax=Sulfuricurvum sp. TaxID=2025608 RepID=UPI0026239A47|nr:aminofutalosine synthase MqnE [Sulfuricurvum sp.]MDD2839462.1 aminofutalosine synthase MqnE [Sulfuricurvum sp.]MDD3596603.1 aminofutalosine synthase MqnE [Sulfuricurvum sp.]MDD4884458.1 aminofutalosine synthase MqnE [Sulfuricurvum sp.]